MNKKPKQQNTMKTVKRLLSHIGEYTVQFIFVLV